jgi:dual specificity protein phosphatase-like protein
MNESKDREDLDAVTHVQDGLYLGNLRYAASLLDHNPEKIDVVINFSEEDLNITGVTVESVPLRDGMPVPLPSILKGLELLRAHLSNGRRVLACCSAGQSRSAAFVVAYLSTRGFEWGDAVEYVGKKRWIMPHPAIAVSMKKFLYPDLFTEKDQHRDYVIIDVETGKSFWGPGWLDVMRREWPKHRIVRIDEDKRITWIASADTPISRLVKCMEHNEKVNAVIDLDTKKQYKGNDAFAQAAKESPQKFIVDFDSYSPLVWIGTKQRDEYEFIWPDQD